MIEAVPDFAETVKQYANFNKIDCCNFVVSSSGAHQFRKIRRMLLMFK